MPAVWKDPLEIAAHVARRVGGMRQRLDLLARVGRFVSSVRATG